MSHSNLQQPVALDSNVRFYLKHDVSENRFCLRLQVGPTDIASLCSRIREYLYLWAHLSRSHLKTEIESNLRNAALYIKERMMYNVQKYNTIVTNL
jgi:hypothetical protein